MADACKRGLRVPARFVPYMEMHRIYELFHDLATELVVKQPDDHIVFIKQTLLHLPRGRNQPKIILIAPPHVEKLQIATVIARAVGLVCVTQRDVLMSGSGSEHDDPVTPDVFARKARKFLRSEPHLSQGWILADFPATRQDAVTLQQAGVLPTHTFQLIPSAVKDTTHLMDCKENKSPGDLEKARGLEEYRRQLLGLREAYKSSLCELDVRDRPLDQLGLDVALLCAQMPQRGAPMLPRILLLGQRGSGRRTQAEMLCARFNLVHVDFDALMAKTRVEEGALSDKVRMIESHYIEVDPDIIIQIIEKCILSKECLKRGWVLTGYPRSLAEFRRLDSTDTPPNRVVFLNVPHPVCVERLAGRRYNMYTGSEHHLVTRPPQGKSKKQIKIHPMDEPNSLEATLPRYESGMREMRDYAGLTATYVDGTLAVNTVFETVSAVVVRPAHAVPPRGAAVEEEPDLPRVERATNTSDMQTVQMEPEAITQSESEPIVQSILPILE